MSPRATRPQFPGHVVTAVIVSHDGDRWVADCLDGLAAQSRPPQRVVAVDTGSTDSSAELLRTRLGDPAVVSLPEDTGLGVAVRAGLDAFLGSPPPPGARGEVTEWLWLLHDDCVPAPNALECLLAEASQSPSVAMFGPKLLTADGLRLAEVGRTIDSSGGIQTGLESRELDQGQHDDAGDVLAVSSAGMLVRRTAWDSHGGFDTTWSLVGEDVDFGWRLNAHGERVRVVPGAVVRHGAALATGERAPDALGARRRPADRLRIARRRHGMQIVLANTSPWLVLPLLVRYVVECLVRALGLLVLGRRPRAARDELVAVAGVLGHPGRLRRARRLRRGRTVPHRELRGLLARPGLRWRRLGDGVAAAFGGRAAADVRRRRRAPVESGPVAAEAESFDVDDTAALIRFLLRPGVLLVLALTAVALVGERHLLGTTLHGGRLLPAPAGGRDLWATYRAGWHPAGLGSAATAPPYLALLAVVSTLLLGKVWLAVVVLVLTAVPLAGLTAYLAAGAVTRSTRLRLVAAVGYALIPTVTGAVATGRVDVLMAIIVLPLAMRAVAGAMRAGTLHRWIGAGLVLAVATAAAPVLWPIAVAVLVVLVPLSGPGATHRIPAALVVLAVPLAVLVPWTGSVLAHPHLLAGGGGLPELVGRAKPLGPDNLLLLRPGGPAMPPAWLLAPLLAAALVGLVRRRGAMAARAGIVTAVAGLAAALVVSRVTVPTGAGTTGRAWAGVPLAAAAAGLLTAAVVAATGARPVLRRLTFGWRQPAAVALAVAVVAGTLGLVVHEIAAGVGGPLTSTNRAVVPVFAEAELGLPTSPRVLVLRSAGGITRYALLRQAAGLRLGDADVAPAAGSPAERRLTAAVRDAVAGQPAAVDALAGFDVSLLVAPTADARALPGLADVDGLQQVPTTGAVVWRTTRRTGELVVLDPPAAATARRGGDVPAGSGRPLPAHPGAAGTRLVAGPAGRLLVLAEPADPHWHATLDGRALAPARAYGWAQAWSLPSTGGRLLVHRGDDGRGWWLVAEVAVLALLLLLALPRLRADA